MYRTALPRVSCLVACWHVCIHTLKPLCLFTGVYATLYPGVYYPDTSLYHTPFWPMMACFIVHMHHIQSSRIHKYMHRPTYTSNGALSCKYFRVAAMLRSQDAWIWKEWVCMKYGEVLVFKFTLCCCRVWSWLLCRCQCCEVLARSFHQSISIPQRARDASRCPELSELPWWLRHEYLLQGICYALSLVACLKPRWGWKIVSSHGYFAFFSLLVVAKFPWQLSLVYRKTRGHRKKQ